MDLGSPVTKVLCFISLAYKGLGISLHTLLKQRAASCEGVLQKAPLSQFTQNRGGKKAEGVLRPQNGPANTHGMIFAGRFLPSNTANRKSIFNRTDATEMHSLISGKKHKGRIEHVHASLTWRKPTAWPWGERWAGPREGSVRWGDVPHVPPAVLTSCVPLRLCTNAVPGDTGNPRDKRIINVLKLISVRNISCRAEVSPNLTEQ